MIFQTYVCNESDVPYTRFCLSFLHLVQKGEFKVAKLEITKGKLKLNRLRTTDLIQGVTV